MCVGIFSRYINSRLIFFSKFHFYYYLILVFLAMIHRQFNKCSFLKLRLVTFVIIVVIFMMYIEGAKAKYQVSRKPASVSRPSAKADERKSVSAQKNPYGSIPALN